MKHKQFDFRTAFIDFLLNMLAGIIFLFILTSFLIIVDAKKIVSEGVKKNAELILQVDWPEDLDCDIDTWVLNPQGKYVSYIKKEEGLMHLERDDKGLRNDVLDLNQLQKSVGNQEIWTLRGNIIGTFIVNLNVYGCTINNRSIPRNEKIVVPIKLELTKLNPAIETIIKIDSELNHVHEEKTFLIFELDSKGNVTVQPIRQVDIIKHAIHTGER